MDGRVLSEEELNQYERDARAMKRFPDDDLFYRLINTIRDRDKTIAELSEIIEQISRNGLKTVERENTILREALERIFNECSNTCIWEIACEALAKLSPDRGDKDEPNRNAQTE